MWHRSLGWGVIPRKKCLWTCLWAPQCGGFCPYGTEASYFRMEMAFSAHLYSFFLAKKWHWAASAPSELVFNHHWYAIPLYAQNGVLVNILREPIKNVLAEFVR